MAVKIEEVKGWLDSLGLKYHDAKEHDSAVHLGLGDDDFHGYIKIELEENGDLIQFYHNEIVNDKILKIKDHEHQALVLQHLLKLNFDEKFGTWEIDPSDGEVRFAIEIPLEDATMTEKQFNRIFKRVAGTDSDFKDINKILETGEIPESDDTEELFAQMMLKMLEDMKKDLESKKKDEDGI